MSGVPKLDYSARDFQTIKEQAIRLIQFFTPEWTDHNEDDFGIVLIGLFSGMADVLHWYVDRWAAENFLETALTRRSVARLLRLIGIELKSPAPAHVNLVFSITSPLGSNLLIPKGTKVATVALEEQIYFETDLDTYIIAGELTSPPVAATEGQTYSESLGISDGTQFQRYTISRYPIIDGSLYVFVNSVAWNKVESLILSAATDESYQTYKDENEQITVQFGDNVNGKIPVPTLPIDSQYRIGGGTYGNVGAGTISVVISTIYYMGNPIGVSVTNPTASSGGEDAESIENAKRRGPAEFKSLNRAVTLSDYISLTEGISGVLRADAIVTGVARITIYVVPVGGGVPSQAFIDFIVDEMEKFRMATDGVIVEGPTYVEVDMEGIITVLSNYRRTDVEDAANAAIDDFYDVENRDFGQDGTPRGDVRISDVYGFLENVRGVDFIELTKLTIRPSAKWLVQTGDAAFSGVIVVSASTKSEWWSVTFTSPTTFKVEGSVSGLQVAVGTIGVLYSSDNNEVTFQIDNAGAPMAIGDAAQFRTSELLGSVDILPGEIARAGTISMTYQGGV
jgi:phage-related baseplate assembly protein